jgi:hypothetical protein
LLGSTWVFDDPHTGLKEEAFVLGMSEMMTFSDEPFADADAELSWLRSGGPEVVPGKDGSASQVFGNWYRGTVAGVAMEGWLCPALGLYFKTAPARVFVKAEPLPAGIDPIWHVDRDAPTAYRFVSAPSRRESGGD